MVQRLVLHAFIAKGLGLIPDQRTKIPQVSLWTRQLRMFPFIELGKPAKEYGLAGNVFWNVSNFEMTIYSSGKKRTL